METIQEKRNVKITKAVIEKGVNLKVEYTELLADGNNKVKKDCKMMIHADLVNAFEKLDYHLAALAFQYNFNGVLDKENVSVDGYIVKGEDDSEAIVLIGSRHLTDSFKTLNIESPAQKLSGDLYDYKSFDELEDIINECDKEVRAYLFEGKHAPEVNPEIPFPDEISDAETVKLKVTRKSNRKKDLSDDGF